MELNNYEKEKICIHNYLLKCETVNLSPGLIDFLRGTINLFNLSKKYNYKFYINRSIHPVFKYFKESKYYINDDDPNNIKNTFEFLSQANASYVNYIIEKMFQNGYNIYAISNCLIDNEKEKETEQIGDECREFLKEILTPGDILKNQLTIAYKNLNISDENLYYCIHIRFGDSFLFNNTFDIDILHKVEMFIKNIIQENIDVPIILITDSSIMGNELKRIIPELYYWNNNKIHLGSLTNYSEEAIVDTLVDILILSKSKRIYTLNVSSIFYTTFSPLIAKIFNIDNYIFKLIL
jgi:hypothetical protein